MLHNVKNEPVLESIWTFLVLTCLFNCTVYLVFFSAEELNTLNNNLDRELVLAGEVSLNLPTTYLKIGFLFIKKNIQIKFVSSYT